MMGRSETMMGRSKTDYGVEQKRTMPRRSDCCHSFILTYIFYFSCVKSNQFPLTMRRICVHFFICTDCCLALACCTVQITAAKKFFIFYASSMSPTLNKKSIKGAHNLISISTSHIEQLPLCRSMYFWPESTICSVG